MWWEGAGASRLRSEEGLRAAATVRTSRLRSSEVDRASVLAHRHTQRDLRSRCYETTRLELFDRSACAQTPPAPRPRPGREGRVRDAACPISTG